jgi:hypothetical protein
MLDLITIISGIIILPIILVLPFSKDEKMNIHKIMSIIFVSSCMILTNTVHIVSLSVIEPLIGKGINLAEYVQVGKFPSVITAIDYLAWGLFMGLSFLFSSFGIEQKIETKKIRYNLLICGIFCIIGFLGSMTINENLWYIAPIGYGCGTLILCINMLIMDKK